MDKLLIRADGNSEIGSGHIMRCSAIAETVSADGCEALFAVSDDVSRKFVEAKGFRCKVVGGDFRHVGMQDADALSDLANSLDVRSVLVDSYAVNDGFFAQLSKRGIACIYIDDAFTFAGGFDARPARRDVAAVINYSFGFGLSNYEAVYSGTSTALHIGPVYAPIRTGFRDIAYDVRSEVGNVLVTSGMTNPNGALERMAAGCRAALPDVRITVVVGASAAFDETCLAGTVFEAVRDVQNMPELMARADLAISAAGTTLYELACVGVPMVVAPVVENQIGNAMGIGKLGLGESFGIVDWAIDDVRRAVSKLAGSYEKRCELSARERELLDGYGACRIYEAVKMAQYDV